MGQRAAQWVALIFLFTHLGASSTEAIGLCDCCGNGTALTPDCRSACATAREEIPMCRPAVLYDGDPGKPPGDNALGVGSLKFLGMGRPDRPALEHFRQWFEVWRSRAEGRFQAALARYESGAGSEGAFAAAEAERDHVLVNYQHGIRRYMEIVRADRPRRAMAALATAPSAKATLVARCDMRGSKRPARQKFALQKIAPQKVVQEKSARVALKTATVCTGNWVNAACAAP